MAEDKQKMRDLFADKTSGDNEPVEETVVEDEAMPLEEDAPLEPEAPVEEEAPVDTETEVDVVKEGKDAYMRFEKSSSADPISALDVLIGELQELREVQVGDGEGFLPSDEAPLNDPSTLI